MYFIYIYISQSAPPKCAAGARHGPTACLTGGRISGHGKQSDPVGSTMSRMMPYVKITCTMPNGETSSFLDSARPILSASTNRRRLETMPLVIRVSVGALVNNGQRLPGIRQTIATRLKELSKWRGNIFRGGNVVRFYLMDTNGHVMRPYHLLDQEC